MGGALHFGPFRLDLSRRQLWRGTQIISLPPKTFDLLAYLAQHAGEVLTREQLFETLWPGTYVDDHALSVQITELRKALGDDARQPEYIETRHRLGYCFVAPVTVASEAAPVHAVGAGHIYPAPAGAAAAPATSRVSIAIPDTHYARSGDVNIAYQVLGDGPVDLVFVMGWVSHIEYFWTEPRFARFLRRLASFSRVILFDKRGTGLSDRVPVDQLPTIEQRMEDVQAVMNAAGSRRAVICGVSEGGCMSAVFAATYPDRTVALILIGSYAARVWKPDYPWAPTREERQQFLNAIPDHWGGPLGIEQFAASLANDPEFRDWWATYLRMGASPGAALSLARMNTEVDIRQVLPHIDVPALVIHRTDDRALNVEGGRYVASRLRRARFVELPGVDHLPFLGDQDAIVNEVERFISQIEANREPKCVLATALVVSFGAHLSHPRLRNHFEEFRATRFQLFPDRTLALFDGPARAVRSARAIRDYASNLGIESRSGLHTGECILRGDGVDGSAVEIAAQIHARAAQGEILVSGTVRDLAAGSGIAFQPAGRFEAAGLGEWQLLKVDPV